MRVFAVLRKLAALSVLIALAAGCSFDRGGLGGAPGDADTQRDGKAAIDGSRQDGAGDGPAVDGLDPKHDGPTADGPKTLPDGPRPDTPPREDGPPPKPDVLQPDILAPDTTDPCAACPLGCDASSSRCAVLVPSTLSLAVTLAVDSGIVGSCTLAPTVGQAYLINTGGSGPTFPGCPGAVRLVTQGVGMPELAVIAFDTLFVGQKAAITVVGSRALVIYARRTLRIDGTINVRATKKTAGPGGKSGGNAAGNGSCFFTGGHGRNGTGKNDDDSGGGGGARGDNGARGGNAKSGQNGGLGGTTGSAPTSIAPLFGGCSGGGGASDSGAGAGGGGGGALHLAAGISVTINGVINAGGGGGGAGRLSESGGGGGSGGTVLLESQAVYLGGIVAANGGGGGAGDNHGLSSNGQPGQDGLASAAQAAGGSVAPNGNSGAGGQGGALAGGAKNGADAQNAGGGGGGVGRIHVRATGASVSGTVSPKQSTDKSISIQ